MSVSLLWPQLAEAVLYTPTRSISKVRLTVASDYIVDSLKSLGKDKVSFAYLAPWQEECGCNTCSPFVAEFRRPHTVRRDRQMLFVLVQFISLIMVSSWLVDVCMLHYYYIYIYVHHCYYMPYALCSSRLTILAWIIIDRICLGMLDQRLWKTSCQTFTRVWKNSLVVLGNRLEDHN